MKVLIADSFPKAEVEKIEAVGCVVVYEPTLKDDTLLQAMKDQQPQILVVRSTKVTQPMIANNAALALIIRAGAGYNTIDVDAASAQSVYVANCPGKNSIAVAELAMGLMMSIDRRIPDNVNDLRNGVWNKKEYSHAEGLFGRTLGVIGTGRIGQELITRANAFGMKVIAQSRSLTPEGATEIGAEYRESLLEVAAESDFVSLHLALTDQTRNLIGHDFFAAMKDGAVLINTSRAEVVDDDALLKAIEEKNIKVGLDVYSDEPSAKSGGYKGKLSAHPAVYGTHHIGASTTQAQMAVAAEATRIVRRIVETGVPSNCVNLAQEPQAQSSLSIRHKNRVGVLADILRVVRENNLNVEFMENRIFSGEQGACANIQLDEKVPSEVVSTIRNASEDILDIQVAVLR